MAYFALTFSAVRLGIHIERILIIGPYLVAKVILKIKVARFYGPRYILMSFCLAVCCCGCQRSRVLDCRAVRKVSALLAESRQRSVHQLHARSFYPPEVRLLLPAAVPHHPHPERSDRGPSPLDPGPSQARLGRVQSGRGHGTGAVVGGRGADRGRDQQYGQDYREHGSFSVSVGSYITSETAGTPTRYPDVIHTVSVWGRTIYIVGLGRRCGHTTPCVTSHYKLTFNLPVVKGHGHSGSASSNSSSRSIGLVHT